MTDPRITRVNDAPIRPDRDYVLYWMVASRRVRHNFALQRAVALCEELGKPLLILEPLRAGYRWASDRLHAFVIDGMRDNAAMLARRPVAYYPYLEPEPGAGRGLVAALATRAAAVVTDDFPCFFLPRMLAATAARLPVRVERVDGNGVYPMREADRVFTTAASFRRHLQRQLPAYLLDAPVRDPLRGFRLSPPDVDGEIRRRWPIADLARSTHQLVAGIAIDHSVSIVATRDGRKAGVDAVARFVDNELDRYPEHRNHPDADAQSHLSPYLHFGHVSAHEVVLRVLERDGWTPDRLAAKPTGSRHGWWGASAAAEAFLDELVTWRELGLNRCALQPDYDQYRTLPDWARATLADHERDPRPYVYSRADLEAARTHDAVWNGAQRQLVRDGTIHNYLRMLWGKKILEWTRRPRTALQVMIELNNKYAVDGRDPNSYSGIFWVLGRYDRAWGPERPVFGKVRYMSSANTTRKLRIADYLRRYAA